MKVLNVSVKWQIILFNLLLILFTELTQFFFYFKYILISNYLLTYLPQFVL